MLFKVLWIPFSQKGAKWQIFNRFCGFDNFWRSQTDVASKKRQPHEWAQNEKPSFSLRAQNSENQKVLGGMFSPNTFMRSQGSQLKSGEQLLISIRMTSPMMTCYFWNSCHIKTHVEHIGNQS